MKKSGNILLLLLVCICISGKSSCFAQETLTVRSAVRDSMTQKGLPDVHIFTGADSVGVKSKADGTFLLSVKNGETVRFRKKGYRWLNIEVRDSKLMPAEMVPSGETDLDDQFEEVEVNGKLLPKDEWKDVNQNYITGVSVLETEKKKFRLILTTK